MNKEIKNKWVVALRSGEYKQGKHLLRSTGNRYCCFGVLCDVLGQEWVLKEVFDAKWTCDGYSGWPPPLATAGIDRGHVDRLVSMNDDVGSAFSEISNYIEKHL
jgi:hypothetical protein